MAFFTFFTFLKMPKMPKMPLRISNYLRCYRTYKTRYHPVTIPYLCATFALPLRYLYNKSRDLIPALVVLSIHSRSRASPRLCRHHLPQGRYLGSADITSLHVLVHHRLRPPQYG